MANKNKVVAVVEDEKVLVKALNVQLLGAGYEVINASDGQAGLTLVKANKPDLLLIDIGLPKMDGLTVLEHLKADESTKHIPVIVLSNFEDRARIDRAMNLGATDYYVKVNTDLEALVQKIDGILN